MLESNGYEPESERSSRSRPLTEPEAQELLTGIARTIVCRGRKTVELAAGEARSSDLKGPTGNFRAPLLQVDDTLLVGFHREALTALLS